MAVVQACSMKRSGSDYVEKTKKSEVAKRCPLRGPLYRWERSWRRARFWHPSPTRRARGGGRTLLRRQPNGSPGVELVTGPFGRLAIRLRRSRRGLRVEAGGREERA